jgi:hypothetical protein
MESTLGLRTDQYNKKFTLVRHSLELPRFPFIYVQRIELQNCRIQTLEKNL